MSKRPCLTRSFNKLYGKRSQTQLKSVRPHLHHIYWSPRNTLAWKKSLFVIQTILGLLIHALTTNGKHSLFNRDNLTQTIQNQVFKKNPFVFYFWKIHQILNILKKKRLPSKLMYSEIKDSGRRSQINV